MIEILEDWNEVKPIFDDVFDMYLPEKAEIIVERNENGEIISFVVVEIALRVGQIFSKGGHPGRVLKYIDKSLSKGAVVLACADDQRFDSLCKKFGMREIPGKVFRLDK